MNISFIETSIIFKTLPIGYYLGRNINCELSESEDGSYFDPIKDNIVISFPMIKSAAVALKDSNDIESIIRGLLYHEISHVLLTPAYLKNDTPARMANAINILEDERIETVCRNFYMNVNFKKNVILLNNYKGEKPKNKEQAFYHLVRYHVGTTYWKKRLTSLITKYFDISAYSSIYNMRNDFIEFYNSFMKSYDEEYTKQNKEDKTSSYFNNDTNDDMSSTKTESKNSATSTSSKSKELTGSTPEEIAEELADNINADYDSVIHEFEDLSDIANKTIKNGIDCILNKYYDENLETRLKLVIDKALKKKNNTGSAISSYSGNFSVRSVTRDDYRWWTQQNRAGHIKQFSKVHFNLFIDNSGSFRSNDDKMNTLIKTLDRIKNPDFSFDIITINTSVVEWENHNRQFKSSGGNKLLPSISDVIKKHTKHGTNNYNIVLFDGDAHSDDEYFHYKSVVKPNEEPFYKFDTNNTYIISDYDNQSYTKNMKNAHIKFVGEYCDEFIETICNLLETTL